MDERLRRRTRGLAKDVGRRVTPRGDSPPRSLFILGCQRSGTTMIVEALDKDWRVKTFPEHSAVNLPADRKRPWSVRATSRYSIRMKPLDQVAAKLERSRYPLVVLKPLVESQKATAILRTIDRAICLWVFRHYRDVAHSNFRFFSPDVNRINLEPLIRRPPDNWRSEFVPEDVRELVARHYSPDMNPFDGGALFWYARNRLFFDLHLAREERVLALKYEDLASEPLRSMRRVYDLAGVAFPGRGIIEDIHPRSVGLGQELELSPEVELACERVWVELNAAYESGRKAPLREDLQPNA
ncbi:MAG TPA: sulfotransferase domain-containing protein [Solirubrobacterales bacterium]|nr:sulfotransferase domain-containing protein [Solirubrobacterales bacterium]